MTGFSLPRAAPRRRPSLTPMIDVVFLLLVFFMLAARFGLDGSLELGLTGGGSAYSGPPRLVDVAPSAVSLNGVSMTEEALVSSLNRLTETGSDPILIRPDTGVDLQRLVDLIGRLQSAGFTGLVVVE